MVNFIVKTNSYWGKILKYIKDFYFPVAQILIDVPH